MHFVVATSLLFAASAVAVVDLKNTGFHILAGLEKRVDCKPVYQPSCSNSCGPGYIVCAEWPNCYNPGIGETCCSNGYYCPKGEYCASTGYGMTCCKDGQSLEACGASATVSTLAPTSSASAASSSTAPGSESSAPSTPSSVAVSESNPPYGTGAPSTYPSASGTGAYHTTSSWSVPVATGAAPHLGAEVAAMALAGVGLGINGFI